MEKKPLSARAALGGAPQRCSTCSTIGASDALSVALGHPLGHDQMIVRNGNFRRVAEHEFVAALAQKACVLIGSRQLFRPLFFNRSMRRGISAKDVFSSPMATSSPPGSASSRSAAFCQVRTWRCSCARVSRSACSASTRSLLALAAMRVESIATRPSFTCPAAAPTPALWIKRRSTPGRDGAGTRSAPSCPPAPLPPDAKRKIIHHSQLHLPRAGDAQRVKPHAQRQLRSVKLPALRAVAELEHAHIQPLNHPTDEKAQVPLAQLIPHTRGQQIPLIRAVNLESHMLLLSPNSHVNYKCLVCFSRRH